MPGRTSQVYFDALDRESSWWMWVLLSAESDHVRLAHFFPNCVARDEGPV